MINYFLNVDSNFLLMNHIIDHLSNLLSVFDEATYEKLITADVRAFFIMSSVKFDSDLETRITWKRFLANWFLILIKHLTGSLNLEMNQLDSVTMCKRTQMKHAGPPRFLLIQQVNLFYQAGQKKQQETQVTQV